MEKVEIIALTLREQAKEAREMASQVVRNMQEIDGARQAMSQFGKEVPNLAELLEKEMADEELFTRMEKDSTAETIRAWVRRYLARIQNMCTAAADHQHRQKFTAEGRLQQCNSWADQLEKRADKELAVAARRKEVEEERAAAAAVEEAEAPKPRRRKPRKKKAE